MKRLRLPSVARHNVTGVHVSAMTTQPAVCAGKSVDAFGTTLDFVARFIHWARETRRSREARLVGKRRLKDLPRALKEMAEILDQEMAVDRLDSYLAKFFDYHQGDSEAAKMRPWNKTSLSVEATAISPEQVIGMPLDELVAMMHISMETELPIHSYTIESGDALQFILGSLARFMGITKKQAKWLMLANLAESKHADKFPNGATLNSAITTAIDEYNKGNGFTGVFEGLAHEEIANAYTNGIKGCEAQWCAEEYRHGQLLRRLIRILTGREPESEKWADPTITKNDDESAFKHLSGRNYTETGSAGTYVFMASHARDELRLALMNLVGDELKHLTVVAAADVYLRGKDANNRLLRMLEKGVAELQEAATVRTAGKKVYSNPINIFEAFMALNSRVTARGETWSFRESPEPSSARHSSVLIPMPASHDASSCRPDSRVPAPRVTRATSRNISSACRFWLTFSIT